MMREHLVIACACGGTEFGGRIEPTFRLRYTSTDVVVVPVLDPPQPIDVYCATCGAAPWNLDNCSLEAVGALAQVTAELTVVVASAHNAGLAQLAAQNTGQT